MESFVYLSKLKSINCELAEGGSTRQFQVLIFHGVYTDIIKNVTPNIIKPHSNYILIIIFNMTASPVSHTSQ